MASNQDLPNGDHYYRPSRISFFQIINDQKFDIVFVGDSLTDDAEWQEFFPKWRVANRGIQGDTTEGLIHRIAAIPSAPRIFVMIGTNDILRGYPIESVLDNYQKILTSFLKLPDRQVFVQSCLLLGNSLHHHNKTVRDINHQLKLLAEKTQRVHYIDINSVLGVGERLNPKLTIDDIHLNGLGYLYWAEFIKKSSLIGP
jgi:lysophospholipase L1-like esterase